MQKTVTATYRSRDAVRNTLDDLVNAGIEREKIYADDEANQVKVITFTEIEPEVLEIMGRHDPLNLH